MNFSVGRRGLAVAATLLLSAVMPATASAAPIGMSSEIGMFGTFIPVGGTTLSSSTGLDFAAPALIAAGVNDFAFSVGSNATFQAFGFDPATSGTIFTFDGGGAFSATSITVDFQTDTALDLTLEGVFSLNGFDDTAGVVVLSADALGDAFTFSAVGRIDGVVPLPGALLFFATALTGLGLTRRRTT